MQHHDDRGSAWRPFGMKAFEARDDNDDGDDDRDDGPVQSSLVLNWT